MSTNTKAGEVSNHASPNEYGSSEAVLPDSIHRLTALVESLHGPLMAYLQAATPNQSDVYSGASVTRLLSQSPIQPYLNDDTVTDILINGTHEIYVNRNNSLEKTEVNFADEKSLYLLASAIAGSVGRSIDAKRPLVDARLKDGSRVNIIAPPMAVDGLTISIRKFPKQEITIDTLIEKGEISAQMAEFLKLCAEHRISLVVSGGTGTGKTTVLNAVSHYIPTKERIITIEDTAELRLQQPHVVRLETKEPQMLGDRQEEVNTSDLIRNALRMRPDRIIIGEVRGTEAYDMIQALNTGHDGSMTTIHANTPRDAFTRIENLIGERMPNTDATSIRRQIASALTLIIQLVRNSDGKRIISSIVEVTGMEGEIPTMQEIFTLREEQGSTPNSPHYSQQWTKIMPRHLHLSQAMRAHPLFIATLESIMA